jgi:pimeloyl-ACP methyl ester carboxylesterase
VAERPEHHGHVAASPDLPFDDPSATYLERAQPALDALDGLPDPVIVVGHSVSSAEAALVAAQHPVALVVYVCPRLGSFAAPPEAPPVFREGFPFPARDDDGDGSDTPPPTSSASSQSKSLAGHFPIQEQPDTLCGALERVVAGIP